MRTKHKHADLIIQWALGTAVESKHILSNCWSFDLAPIWSDEYEYRIKPVPKPDVTVYANVDEYLANDFKHNAVLCGRFSQQREFTDNIKVTYRGETGNLIAIEMIEQE